MLKSLLSDQHPFEITIYKGKSSEWVSSALRVDDVTVLWIIDGIGQQRIDLVDYSITSGQVTTLVYSRGRVTWRNTWLGATDR